MNLNPSQIGVAVVGLGIGEQHARAFLATDHCQLRWLYDFDMKKSQRLTLDLGTGTPAENLEQILNDPTVQVISIASYDDAHFGQVVAALEAGKHVFCEKPLCRTLEELRTIKETWSRHKGKLKLSSNLILRTAPAYRWLKQDLENGDFGEVYAFDGDYLYGRIHKITEGWRKDVVDYSVLLGGGIHLFDLMVWLTGQRPSFVSAIGNRICTANTMFQYKDYVAATLECPSGMVGRITANFGCVHGHQHIVRLFGTKATFVCDDSGPRLHMRRDPSLKGSPIALSALAKSKGELIAPFVSAILNDKDLEAETQAFFDVMSICIACETALHSSSTEEVQYI